MQGSQERHCREYISQRTSQILQGSQENQEINLSHMKVGYQYRVCNYVYDESIDKHLCNTKYEKIFLQISVCIANDKSTGLLLLRVKYCI